MQFLASVLCFSSDVYFHHSDNTNFHVCPTCEVSNDRIITKWDTYSIRHRDKAWHCVRETDADTCTCDCGFDTKNGIVSGGGTGMAWLGNDGCHTITNKGVTHYLNSDVNGNSCAPGLDLVSGGSEKRAWTVAQNVCGAMNPPRRLPEPKNDAENAQVNAFIDGEHQWIGYTDKRSEGKFILDSSSAYKNFKDGEPNSAGGNENCVELYHDTGLWNDKVCTHLNKFACELPKYTHLLGPMTIADARTTCASIPNGNIASPRNRYENQMLLDAGVTLIGLDDTHQEGYWMTHGNKGSKWENWAANEPNDLNGEDCVELREDGTWNDITCTSSTTQYYFICEWHK